jgi:hypothetical protein
MPVRIERAMLSTTKERFETRSFVARARRSSEMSEMYALMAMTATIVKSAMDTMSSMRVNPLYLKEVMGRSG